MLGKKKQQPRIIHLAKLFFRIEGETFPDKAKLKEFITTTPALQEMLKGSLRWNESTLLSNRTPYESKW